MYVRDKEAWVASRENIGIQDFPEVAQGPLTRFFLLFCYLPNNNVSAWAYLYFLLQAKPDDPAIFPLGKAHTLEHLETLLRSQAATELARYSQGGLPLSGVGT